MLNTYLGHGEREGWLLHTCIIETEVRTEITRGKALVPYVGVGVCGWWLMGAAGQAQRVMRYIVVVGDEFYKWRDKVGLMNP